MFKFLTHAISSAIGFSKTESRGTLVLIFIIFSALVFTRVRISFLKNQPTTTVDSTALEWVKTVHASYQVKEIEERTKDPIINSDDKKKSQPEVAELIAKSDHKQPEKIHKKDLNIATAIELQNVRGIGPAYSKRIIKYRDLLGGFADVNQITEVYGLTPETIDELFKHYHITSQVVPLEINSDSIKVLAKHPYISYDLARIIINFRKAHGNIQSAEDLKKIKAIDEGTFLRLRPYLD